MIGQWDSGMDCSNLSPVKPYPQFYPYYLIGNILGLGNNSYLAPEVYSSINELVVSAFFNVDGENLIIANPRNEAYNTSILFENNFLQGNSLNFTLYEIKGNTTGEYITKNQLSFDEVSNGYLIHIDIKPYSVIGVSLRYSGEKTTSTIPPPTTSITTSTTSITSPPTTTKIKGQIPQLLFLFFALLVLIALFVIIIKKMQRKRIQ